MILDRFKKDMRGSTITKQEGNSSLLLLGSILDAGFPPYTSMYYKFDFKSFIFLVKDKLGTVFFDNEIYTKFTEEAYLKYKELKGLEELREVRDYNIIKHSIDQKYTKYSPSHINGLSDKETKNLMIELYDLADKLLISTVYSEALSDELIRELYKRERGKEELFIEFLNEVSKPVFESFLIRMDRLLIDKKSKEDYDLQWILCDYSLGPNISETNNKIEEVVTERKGMENIMEELDIKTKEIRRNMKETENYKKDLTENLRKLFDFAQLTMYVRDARKEPVQKIFTIISNLVREMFKRRGLNQEDAANCFCHDFKSDVYDRADYGKIISKRKAGEAIYSNGIEIIYDYDNFEKLKKELYHLLGGTLNTNEIKGSISCRGYVRAIARIILSEKDFNKFKDGEILVTSMTRPEFVPLMRKASAIVTDEGGITSNAAIISRELQK